MKVGYYAGEVRGPFHVDTARQLVDSGQAVQAEFRNGKFVAPASEETPTKQAKKPKAKS